MLRPKFGIAREDPLFELSAVDAISAKHLVCVGSGGCIPLSLKAERPHLMVSAFDFNPDQINLIRAKNETLSLIGIQRDLRLKALNASGEFEGLFRLFRECFLEFILSPSELDVYFSMENSESKRSLAEQWVGHRYWLSPFELVFSDSFLRIMFGDNAIQHALPNSYVPYFESLVRGALLSENGFRNPFLQHLFLGDCHESLKPPYWRVSQPLALNLTEGGLLDVPNLLDASVVSLSNIFDWSNSGLIHEWSTVLKGLRKGALVLIRQLNNTTDLGPYFLPEFKVHTPLERFAHSNAKALFYNQYRVFERL